MHLFNKNFKTVIVNTVVFLFSLNIGWADIIITEIADPDNATGVRYIEIHNSGGSSVALTDYYIIRFTNANTEATSNIDLSNYILAVKNCWIIFL